MSDFFYTPSNTRNTYSGLLLSAGQLLVPTSPDGLADGGSNAQPLGQADGSHYVAGTAAPGSTVYDLTPVRFNSGVVMSGNITASYTNGALNISDRNIRIRQVTDESGPCITGRGLSRQRASGRERDHALPQDAHPG